MVRFFVFVFLIQITDFITLKVMQILYHVVLFHSVNRKSKADIKGWLQSELTY